jgi:hypothetical protein
VKTALAKFDDLILSWVRSEYEVRPESESNIQWTILYSGVSLFYLCYFLAADKGGEAGVIEYMKESVNDKTRGHSVEQAKFARRVVRTLADHSH